jgi:hypothetical protein
MFEPEVEDTDDWETSSANSAEFDLDPDADEEPAYEVISALEYIAELRTPLNYLRESSMEGLDLVGEAGILEGGVSRDRRSPPA